MCQKEDCYLVETGCWINTTKGKLFRRNQYIPQDQIDQFINKQSNYGIFTTTYRYNTTNIGEAYLFSDLYFDFDCKDDFELVREDAIRCMSYLTQIFFIDIQFIEIYFSGNKGIHIMIPSDVIGIEPDLKLNCIYKHIANDIQKFIRNKTLDTVIYDNKRMFRIPGSVHEKTGLHKIPITIDELRTLSHDDILKLAGSPRAFTYPTPVYNQKAAMKYKEYIDEYIESTKVKVNFKGSGNLKYMPPCVEHILEHGAPEGKRNNSIVALASYYRNSGNDYLKALDLIKEWNDTKNVPATPDLELERSVRSIYSGRANYGCATLKTISECDFKNCKLMKKRQGVGNP